MSISYRPLFLQLANKGLKKTDVIKKANLTTNVMANIGKNKSISIKNIEKICMALDCSPNEIFEFVPKIKGDKDETDY